MSVRVLLGERVEEAHERRRGVPQGEDRRIEALTLRRLRSMQMEYIWNAGEVEEAFRRVRVGGTSVVVEYGQKFRPVKGRLVFSSTFSRRGLGSSYFLPTGIM